MTEKIQRITSIVAKSVNNTSNLMVFSESEKGIIKLEDVDGSKYKLKIVEVLD